ncbi:ABC transporter permease [Phytomonospora endophytica]|uniref:Osmoprotectant transport system permease protein n=1 Tax=Phytomonospora endophytica TaxID=714109 RepID=A0A841FTT1_9ACTN|nr:ABC transporter permease [Phytomonospora endophytica]MBB6039194.1 osmoprotectant transport system permease protein [Phytomonospora endophytica]GIG67569.1 ABC transporter permease [Phytomonospora endophytica]
MSFWDYVTSRWDLLLFETYQHASMVFQCVLLATVIGLAVAVATYRTSWLANLATGTASVIFTIPSFAMFGLMIPVFGLGVVPSVVALTLYALLPIIRNCIVGLSGVDPAMVDAARGMGMSRAMVLARVELPLAWPVILTGVRVSTMLTMGVAAIAAYVSGPGLGDEIFSGLARLGGANALNAALAGTLGIILLALLFDAAYILIGRLTTSRGLRV